MILNEGNANSVVEVDLRNVKWNIERIQNHIGPNVKILYTAKSNGYGLGLVPESVLSTKQCFQ